MHYDASDSRLWGGVIKQAVLDLVKGLSWMTGKKECKGSEYTLNRINTAFSFLFDDEHPVSEDLRGVDVLEMAGCVRTIHRLTIERCRRRLKPAALRIFERALERLK